MFSSCAKFVCEMCVNLLRFLARTKLEFLHFVNFLHICANCHFTQYLKKHYLIKYACVCLCIFAGYEITLFKTIFQ